MQCMGLSTSQYSMTGILSTTIFIIQCLGHFLHQYSMPGTLSTPIFNIWDTLQQNAISWTLPCAVRNIHNNSKCQIFFLSCIYIRIDLEPQLFKLKILLSLPSTDEWFMWNRRKKNRKEKNHTYKESHKIEQRLNSG